jgi:hypothetical protein
MLSRRLRHLVSLTPLLVSFALLAKSGLAAQITAEPARPEVTKRSDLTHKRTNHELRPLYERHRARP